MDNSTQYKAFREAFSEFIYEDYTISESEGSLDIAFNFSIPGLARFRPAWSFSLLEPLGPSIDRQCLDGLVFSLGMVELISYWKICCPPRVRIMAGTLDNAQAAWWKKLYVGGLGEYFYKNGISPGDDFMEIISHAPTRRAAVGSFRTAAAPLPKVLVPIGGGKDSAVTLELLRVAADRYGYVINPRGATDNTAVAAGIGADKMVIARRTLDENMLLLNKQGFLNGHTPFSAIVAFSSVLAGYINGLDFIALSNESSANEMTVAGSDVNHQYSKSFGFELDFRRYEREYLCTGVEYFSLLRPLSELQIARLFAGYKQYHPIFRSCNAASKLDEWCGVCPKCLFVYIILSPFLEERELAAIFYKNLFADLSLKDTLDELVGFTPEKPFECVGSRDEVRASLELTAAKYNKRAEPLPPLLSYYCENRRAAPVDTEKILTCLNAENAVPPYFLSIVMSAAKVGYN